MIEGYLYTEWHLIRHEQNELVPGETDEEIGSYMSEQEAWNNFHAACKDYIDDVMLGRDVPITWFEIVVENHCGLSPRTPEEAR